MKTALESLIHPKTSAEFFAAYETNTPFVVHNLKETVVDLTTLPFLNSLEDLIASWPKDIQAHLPDVRDEASSIDTTAKDAKKLFDNKMGLLFNYADTISPVLTSWLHQLRLDLGLSALTIARCLMYATPSGAGTATHFDQNINFVFQVSGKKRWWLAANNHVENPMTRHTIGLETDPELESYTHGPMPTTMPDDAVMIELNAGSMLFVPRGCWHTTHAESDALSLNFTFTAPTWIDLFTAAIRGRLAQSTEWRETANGVSDPLKKHDATMKFSALLLELVQDLPYWQAQQILEATETDSPDL